MILFWKNLFKIKYLLKLQWTALALATTVKLANKEKNRDAATRPKTFEQTPVESKKKNNFISKIIKFQVHRETTLNTLALATTMKIAYNTSKILDVVTSSQNLRRRTKVRQFIFTGKNFNWIRTLKKQVRSRLAPQPSGAKSTALPQGQPRTYLEVFKFQ